MATATKNGKAKKAESWHETPGREAKNAEHLEAMQTKEPKIPKGVQIVLPKLDIRIAKIEIVGDTPLIVHAWSRKAVLEMLAKHMGLATAGREKKDPVADFLGSLYIIEPGKVQGEFKIEDLEDGRQPDVWIQGGRYGFPAVAFKNAAVEACTSLGRSAITKVQARQCFHVMGELVEVKKPPRMRMDMVRLTGQGNPPDVRFRAEFPEWSTVISVRYNARVLSADQILNLFNTAGFAVGVGEWRSERGGQSGLFHVKTEGE